ncbi:protein tyrosine phosphatase (plasmid) [Rhizobium sp. ACO-34A]|nr:dual specificity protein phosphatase family protein [Rhizobium sp. ACO-34A]ATN36996.1 protein tyrosine phosphatase [Rhizobium sp. ACO-34A]
MPKLTKFFWRRTFRFASIVVVAVGLTLGGYLGYLQWSGNFHTVVEGQLYRSAQPSASQIADYVQRYGIKTIINLRGQNEQADWYNAEIAMAKQVGIRHVDFRMSARRIVTRESADNLITIMKNAPKPILIHCQAGADRSGIVAAIYSKAIAGVAKETAEKQLSIFFGHVGIPYLSSTFAMDQSWEMLEKQLKTDG